MKNSKNNKSINQEDIVMKKSNKLLLAGFILGLLLLSAIHIALYAKYKNGNYTIYNPADHQETGSAESFPQVNFVSIRNIPGAFINFSNTAQVIKDEAGIVYIRKGDNLLISAMDSVGRGGTDRPRLTLPYNATVHLFNSSVSFQKGQSDTAGNPVVYLHNAQAIFSGANTPLRFGHIRIIASGNSGVTFDQNSYADHLELILSNSSFGDSGSEFGQISIVTDSLSHIALQSKHLIKAKINTIPPR
ncbi:MAG: hypothetical protein V4722_27110 [Bacteroidota bacterium]